MASMSKRAQARTEKELQELLSFPGNSTCADCGNRNPAWASWSIGIFLCMRCATLHRKLGTHISKVKSLTMDTWSSEQVESMRRNGNIAVNKTYNPKNRKPDIPLDADEVDNAMERFIRKKYQEKSLSDGRPEVPSRDEPIPIPPRSPNTTPPPIQPTKKKGFWGGLGLRSSSSAYPLSKHDKKHRSEAKVENGFRISSDDYSTRPKINARSTSKAELSEQDLQAKLAQLRDMGFRDTEKNSAMLRKTRGDIEMVIAALVKQSSREAASSKTKQDSYQSPTGIGSTSEPVSASGKASNNPFDALDKSTHQPGLGATVSSQHSPNPSGNPWQTSISAQQHAGLEQSFSGMQINSRPLFPHNTGGYTAQQDPRFYQPMTPPIPLVPQTYSLTASPITTNNPFMQQTPLSAHSTGSNPYAAHMHATPTSTISTNPFYGNGQNSHSQPASPAMTNPFGLPPSQFETQQNSQTATGQFTTPGFQNQSSFQTQMVSPATSSPGFPNYQYGQPQLQYQQPQPQQQQQTMPAMQNNQFAYNMNQQPQQQQSPLTSQQTGRFDKKSILALYSYPQFAPQQTLAPIPEPAEPGQQASGIQPTSPAPSDVYSQQPNPLTATKRASTMPLQAATNLHQQQPQQQQSRNPFMSPNTNINNNNEPFSAAPMQAQSATQSSNSSWPQFSPLATSSQYATTQTFQPTLSTTSANTASRNPYAASASMATNTNGIRHTSAESMSVNHPNLLDGRHSPDVWGGLSARYVR